MAFAPLACNLFGQQAPEMLRYQWIVANRAAQRVVSLLDFSLLAAADLPGVVDEHASPLQLYGRRRQRFLRQSVQEVLVAIFEDVRGSLAAPSLFSPILNTLTFSAVVLFRGSLTFLHAPMAQGSPSGPPPDIGPATRSPGAVSPVSPSPSPGPHSQGGASAVRTHYRRFSNAPRHPGPPPALRRPVHRPWRVPPTAYLGGDFWLFTSGGARAPRPDGGGPPGQCLDSPSSPLGRARSSWATPGPSHFQCPREPLS